MSKAHTVLTHRDADAAPPACAVPPYVRAHFVRRVYALVAVQLGTTAGAAALCAGPLRAGAAAAAPYLVLGGSFWALALACAQPCVRGRAPWNVLALGAFTLAESACVGGLAAVAPPGVILVAAAATAALFAGLSLLACALQRPLQWEGHCLALLVAAGAMAFVGCFYATSSSALALGVGFVGILGFAGLVLHDTSQLLHVYGPDDALDAALQLYLDALNLFLCALQVLQASEE
tara:strand:- start:275 stop:976 length:702 start_codon:yes stop_codon:yes gene_type:complete